MNNDILKVIADNPALLKAVRETIEKRFSLEKLDTSLDNEKMGEIVRASVEGLVKIDLAFKEIEKYKTQNKEPERIMNPAR